MVHVSVETKALIGKMYEAVDRIAHHNAGVQDAQILAQDELHSDAHLEEMTEGVLKRRHFIVRSAVPACE